MNTEPASIKKQLWVGLGFAAIVSLGLFLLFSRPALAANNAGEKLVTIHDNYADTEQTIATRARTVDEALKKAKISVHSHDTIEPKLQTQLIRGTYYINIYRARPVTIIDGPTTIHTFHSSQIIPEIIQAAGLKTAPEDIIETSPIANFVSDRAVGLKITIRRMTKIVEETIPFTIRQEKASDKPVGSKHIQTKGVDGKQLVTYKIDPLTGQVTGVKIRTVVTVPMVEQVEVIGTKMTNTFNGSFAEALARLRSCESGGNYANERNPRYRGAYQFSYGTWANYQGFYDPADAPPPVQDQKAWETYQRRGWQPWPACSQKLGLQDVYR